MDTVGLYLNLKGKNAESFVHDLAIKTFLTDWCFLNPKLPSGKELCDLLVVFNDVAIIWQIKNIPINEKGMYKESEVNKNIRQISGAKRQLFDLKTPIRLSNPRRGKENFDPSIIKDIYLISVLFGNGESIFSFVDEIKNHTVHIFTKEFVQIILNELNTISDFTQYLKAKERFIKNKKRLVILGGEEELLAFYLMNNRSFERLDDAQVIAIQAGSWDEFQNSERGKQKKVDDKISFFWDDLINKAHEASPKEHYEVIARELARVGRFQRRVLSKSFYEAHLIAHKNDAVPIFRRLFDIDGVTYCFLFKDDPEPRKLRKLMLGQCCFVARGIYKHNQKVIGIATEKKIRQMSTYDFCLLEQPNWTKENETYKVKLQNELGIFTNLKYRPFREDEYRSNDH